MGPKLHAEVATIRRVTGPQGIRSKRLAGLAVDGLTDTIVWRCDHIDHADHNAAWECARQWVLGQEVMPPLADSSADYHPAVSDARRDV